jgi:Cu/Zn superoxide dismutase
VRSYLTGLEEKLYVGANVRGMATMNLQKLVSKVTLLLGAALVIALAGGASAEAQQGRSARLELSEVGNSGVSGTADLREVEGGTEVTMNVQGLPEAGVEHINHFHGGATCSDIQNGENMPPVTIPLTTIVAQEDGTGSATTTLDNVTMDQLFDNREQRIILVHAKAREGEPIPPVIACADVNTRRAAAQSTMKESTQPLPKSGGMLAASLLLPATALLMGVGVLGYALLKRR